MLAKKLEAYQKGNIVSAYDLKKELPVLKRAEETSWLKEIDSQALGEAVLNMDRAFKNFFRELKKGNKKGFPKFKSKHNSRQSYQYPQRVKLNEERTKIYLPKIGYVKAKVHREIEGEVKTVTISLEANQYHASILVKSNENSPPGNNGKILGVDMGVKRFATLSDKSYIEPLPLDKELKRLKRIQKKLSNQKKGSKNRARTKMKLAKQHLKISNKRKDFLHKESKRLSENQAIIVEDLSIRNMSKSAKGSVETRGNNVKQKSGLNRVILQQGWGMFFQFLEYKLRANGGYLLKVSPKNTSKTCPECNHVAKENRKTQADFTCRACNFSENADYVASLNIKARGAHDLTKMLVLKSA